MKTNKKTLHRENTGVILLCNLLYNFGIIQYFMKLRNILSFSIGSKDCADYDFMIFMLLKDQL